MVRYLIVRNANKRPLAAGMLNRELARVASDERHTHTYTRRHNIIIIIIISTITSTGTGRYDTYFAELFLAILRLGTEERHGRFPFARLLAAHAGPLHLPDLAAGHLDVAGAAANARERGDRFRHAARILQHVDDGRYLAVV